MKIKEHVSLKPFNTFGVDTASRYFAEINSAQDIADLLAWRQQNDLPCLLVGGGSNLLFKNDYPGLVALIRLVGRELLFNDDEASYVRAGAGENWHQFVRWSIKQGYAGLENLSLIPGTVGAAPVQNIGAYGVELKDRFHALQAIDLQTGELREFDLAACQFNYRDSFFKSVQPERFLITSVTFRLPHDPQWTTSYAGVGESLNGQEPTAELISDLIINIRQSKLPDPSVIGNAGSFFKNPIVEQSVWQSLKDEHPNIPGYPQPDGTVKSSAAWLIDQCGWKGYQSGAAGVYKDHALVLVNHGGASGAELWTVAENIIRSVEDRFSIMLEPEPRVI